MDIIATQQKLEKLGYKKEKKQPIGFLHIGPCSFIALNLPQGEKYIAIDICSNYGDADTPLWIRETLEIRGDHFIRYGFCIAEREVWVPQ
jgi:hypothetical protein